MIQLRDECRLFVADRCAPDLLIFTRRVGTMIFFSSLLLLLFLYKYLFVFLLRKNESLTDDFVRRKINIREGGRDNLFSKIVAEIGIELLIRREKFKES